MALTEGQQRFVVEYVKCGAAATAYRAAFPAERKLMGDGQDGARQNAHALMQNEEIQRAIFDETKKRLAKFSPIALAVLEKLATDSDLPNIKFQAAVKLLELSGYKPKEQTEVTFVDERSDDELKAFVLANADIVTPKKLDS